MRCYYAVRQAKEVLTCRPVKAQAELQSLYGQDNINIQELLILDKTSNNRERDRASLEPH